MPKPLPDYIPGEIRDQIASGGYAGVIEYGEHIGLKRGARLLDVFGGTNPKLRPYKMLADYAGITLDEIVSLMLSGRIGPFITELAEKENLSISKLSKRIGVSDDFLGKRIRGGVYTNGLSNYIEVAQALGWSLDKLAKSCLR